MNNLVNPLWYQPEKEVIPFIDPFLVASWREVSEAVKNRPSNPNDYHTTADRRQAKAYFTKFAHQGGTYNAGRNAAKRDKA